MFYFNFKKTENISVHDELLVSISVEKNLLLQYFMVNWLQIASKCWRNIKIFSSFSQKKIFSGRFFEVILVAN